MKYKYDKSTNTLRQLPKMREPYPCSGEGWEDGKEYEEGEFEVKVVEVYSSGGSSRHNDYKLPNGEIITCHRDTPPKVAVLKQKEVKVKMTFGLTEKNMEVINKHLSKWDGAKYDRDTWVRIGNEIGWEPLTAAMWYFRKIQKPITKN